MGKLFWYTRQEELDFVYQDYVILCERMGFIPPRIIVEKNIQELSRRILYRQSCLAALIQRMWRGFMSRRIVRFFKREVIRLRQVAWGKIMKLQRVYRGHRVRLRIIGIKLERHKELQLKQYLLET